MVLSEREQTRIKNLSLDDLNSYIKENGADFKVWKYVFENRNIEIDYDEPFEQHLLKFREISIPKSAWRVLAKNKKAKLNYNNILLFWKNFKPYFKDLLKNKGIKWNRINTKEFINNLQDEEKDIKPYLTMMCLQFASRKIK